MGYSNFDGRVTKSEDTIFIQESACRKSTTRSSKMAKRDKEERKKRTQNRIWRQTNGRQ